MENTIPMALPTPSSTNYRVAPSASSAQRTIQVVGDAWTLKILRALFRGETRFGDFVADCGVSRAVLTDRLTRLVEHKVVSRDVTDGGHPAYSLTNRGEDLWGLFLAMWLWEADWDNSQAPDTQPMQVPRALVKHLECGQAMRPSLHCQHCSAPVSPFETRVLLRPADDDHVPSLEISSAFRKGRSSDGHAPNTQKLIQVIGDRWNAAVVAMAFKGVKTFSGFEQALGIRPAQLSNRLTQLLGLGILRQPTTTNGRHQYRLSQAGIALFGVTLELVRWGNHWLSSEDEQLVVQHLPCGQALITRWCCGHCKQPLTRDALDFY